MGCSICMQHGRWRKQWAMMSRGNLDYVSTCKNLTRGFRVSIFFILFGIFGMSMWHSWSNRSGGSSENWFFQVILLRFGRDYDPDCKLMDDVLLAISESVKVGAVWMEVSATQRSELGIFSFPAERPSATFFWLTSAKCKSLHSNMYLGCMCQKIELKTRRLFRSIEAVLFTVVYLTAAVRWVGVQSMCERRNFTIPAPWCFFSKAGAICTASMTRKQNSWRTGWQGDKKHAICTLYIGRQTPTARVGTWGVSTFD